MEQNSTEKKDFKRKLIDFYSFNKVKILNRHYRLHYIEKFLINNLNIMK